MFFLYEVTRCHRGAPKDPKGVDWRVMSCPKSEEEFLSRIIDGPQFTQVAKIANVGLYI